MKKIFLLFFAVATLIITSCGDASNQKKESFAKVEEIITELTQNQLEEKTFDELFKSIPASEISENVFKLVGTDYTVITAGTETDYNSMVASWGGFGILFNKPTTWCMLRANRYTLEYMKKTEIYTMSYFDDVYKEQIMLFGTKSGRDSEKMKEHTLNEVKTPSGSMSYKEAKLIIECKLTEITTVSPKDYYSEEGKQFVIDAYKEAKDYHKLVFGEITGVWIR